MLCISKFDSALILLVADTVCSSRCTLYSATCTVANFSFRLYFLFILIFFINSFCVHIRFCSVSMMALNLWLSYSLRTKLQEYSELFLSFSQCIFVYSSVVSTLQIVGAVDTISAVCTCDREKPKCFSRGTTRNCSNI